jgi:hypothetical protein
MQPVSPNRLKCLPKTLQCPYSILTDKLRALVNPRTPSWGPVLNLFSTALFPAAPQSGPLRQPEWCFFRGRTTRLVSCVSFQKPRLRQHVTTPNRTSTTSRRQLSYKESVQEWLPYREANKVLIDFIQATLKHREVYELLVAAVTSKL